jgi:hypothetical protein
MKELAPDEKISTVMVYTETMLARGDLVSNENTRVSTWLRTQGVPNFIHLHKAQLILLGSASSKTYAREEVFIPTPAAIGFHLAPPARDPLDYDPSESHRKMEMVHVQAGSFEIKAKIRVSTQTDLASSLDVMRFTWLSLYDAEITNPHLPQLNLVVPIMLARPEKVTISLM